MERMINFYNQQRTEFHQRKSENPELDLEEFIDNDPAKISWDSSLKNHFTKNKKGEFNSAKIRLATYRPFVKSNLYYDRMLNNSIHLMHKIFPEATSENLLICISGRGCRTPFCPFISEHLVDFAFADSGAQCFARYNYTEDGKREDNIMEPAVNRFREFYNNSAITGDDIFYYTYGFLHLPSYRATFASDVRKELARITQVKDHKDFQKISEVGKQLADLHLNYENAEPHPKTQLLQNGKALLEEIQDPKLLRVTKMTLAKDHTSVIYNQHLTIAGIPPEAITGYQVNGYSPTQWIVNRYQTTTDRKTGITNDPNLWNPDDPMHIINLVRKSVTISLTTQSLISQLPKIQF